jgi:hypothetical protein
MIESEMRKRGHRKGFILAAAVFLAGVPVPVGGLQPPSTPAAGPESPVLQKPRLVVFLVVDQLRGDLLTRYYPLFSGGLKQLMDEGFSYAQALHAHSATETSPGHATLSTGVYPARAGIPANAWREDRRGERRAVINVVDPEYPLVGAPELPGASPGVLRREGLADWVLASDGDARVLSISAKDRAAVLMAGRARGQVYWFSSQLGRFVTSTFYRAENPSWVDRFNVEVMPRFRADSVWTSTIPPGEEGRSSPDTASFEADGVNTFFPHRHAQERIDPTMDDFFLWFEGTPMLDEATLLFAEVAVRETGAGSQDGRTDFLSVSLSQTDRVGHDFGPLSREQMDNLLRLDRGLGSFLAFLDRTVGKENYVLGFTADHGVMTMPERLPAGGRRLSLEDRTFLQTALNEAAGGTGQGTESSLASRLVEKLQDVPFVGPAFTHEDLRSRAVADSLGILFLHSFVPDRGGGLLSVYGVEMWWAENTLDWGFPTGTTHGSPFHFDRWVPLIVAGPGVPAGVAEVAVRPMDLAPTLAWMAGIPYPDDLDGKLLPLGEG